MFVLRHGSRRIAQGLRSTIPKATRRTASRIAIPLPSTPPPVPMIEKCPSPTCQCRETPAGLDIERETDLNGSMAAYAEQLLLCTGKEDWKSKTEDEEDAVLLRQLRKYLVRGGKYVDVRGWNRFLRSCILDTDTCSVAISQCASHIQLVPKRSADVDGSDITNSEPGIDRGFYNVRVPTSKLSIRALNTKRPSSCRSLHQGIRPSGKASQVIRCSFAGTTESSLT